MTVIEIGMLKGFISINRTWAGYGLDEYLEACRSAMGEDTTENAADWEIGAEEEAASENAAGGEQENRKQPDRFQVANHELFSRVGEPRMTLNRRRLSFSKACTGMLAVERVKPKTVEILLNPVRRIGNYPVHRYYIDENATAMMKETLAKIDRPGDAYIELMEAT